MRSGHIFGILFARLQNLLYAGGFLGLSGLRFVGLLTHVNMAAPLHRFVTARLGGLMTSL